VLDTKSPKYLEMAQGHISLSKVVSASPARGWPRAIRDCISLSGPCRVGQRSRAHFAASLEMPSGKSEVRCLSRVGLGRVVTASPAWGWPRASCDYVSLPGLTSGKSWLHISPGVGLGRVVTASLGQGWPQTNRTCVPPSRVGLGRVMNIPSLIPTL
jgi:hypothetical protein